MEKVRIGVLGGYRGTSMINYCKRADNAEVVAICDKVPEVLEAQKEFAKGLDIKRNVNSPTFTIIKEYQGRLPLYHMDVYRLENGAEDMGLDDYLFGEGVCVVEWASMIEDILPKERLDIKVYREGENDRRIELTPVGEFYESVKEVL